MRPERFLTAPRRSSHLRNFAQSKIRRLTTRQLQLLKLHSEGSVGAKAVERIGIPISDLDTYHSAIKLKLGVRNLAEAINIARIAVKTPKKPAEKRTFGHTNLLGISDLSKNDIVYLLDRSDEWSQCNLLSRQMDDRLFGLVVVNCFFENSTRTLVSFEMAAKRLGGSVINFDASRSSLNKGETMEDTAETINAMQPDVVVIRHSIQGMARRLTSQFDCPIINAGDGENEHPTQALVDALTIRQARGRIEGLVVAICGDIRHSRVARSNIIALGKLGAHVRVIGPEQLLPDRDAFEGIEAFTDLDLGIRGADVVMMLRMQRERMSKEISGLFGSNYFNEYGLTRERLELYAPEAYVMHPGPLNRGVEIEDAVADDPARSLILKQVQNGVAVRMACLSAVTEAAA